MRQAGGQQCYNHQCDVGMISVREDYPMGMSMLPASERGAKTSYFSSFGLIKVGFILRLCFCVFITLFILINFLLAVNTIHNSVSIVTLSTNHFVGTRTKQMGTGGLSLVQTQKKLVSGRRICFAKALETTSSGEEKCSPHHYLVLKWDMEFFHLNIYVTMHMLNV